MFVTSGTARSRQARAPLSRERVLAEAVVLADENGIGSLTMRRLADRLHVEPMSLYYHVANKDEILDGMVDAVFGEIELPAPHAEWKTAMRDRAASARDALRRHPWAVSLMESRLTPGPATLRHHDAVIGCLRNAGFTIELSAHAFSIIPASKDAAIVRNANRNGSTLLGYNVHGEPWLWPDLVRMKHGVIVGGTGAGKSTFLENIIAQDVTRRFGARPMPRIAGCGQFSSFFFLRPTSCAAMRPPLNTRLEQSRKISRHCELHKWRRETATYQANASTAQANSTRTPAASSGPRCLHPGWS